MRASPAWSSIRQNLPPIPADPERGWLPAQLSLDEWFERSLLEMPQDAWDSFYAKARVTVDPATGAIRTGDPIIDALERAAAEGRL